MNDVLNEDDADKTRPPQGALRFDTPQDLYAALPQIAELTQQRPRENEDALHYLGRLRSSTTPEEAVTYTAFAALPQMAIWWGHECLRVMPEVLDQRDRAFMEMIAAWIATPTKDLRHSIMKEALWANGRTPAVMLGLAVGWSGGAIAPNDPAPVPPYRAPRSINSSVLSCLARADLTRRPVYLARFIDMAESLYRVY
ncbi:hypothetical protein [Ascidiaceihabitans sp.]|uniref:DUF6931 family protein n=1 Tax=Ascidiaceihabitans sp. TaxID=1872644 RepID=UPI003296856F